MWTNRPRPHATLLRLGLLVALAACVVGSVLPFLTDAIFEDDTFMRVMLTAVILVVSLSNIYVLRSLVLPAQMLAAENRTQPADTQTYTLMARSSGVLAMTFILADGVYAIVLALFTGWPWIVAPFALIALIKFGAFSSYIERELTRIWRDKVQLGSPS